MGWYITCYFCGLVEKYKHPDCACRRNQYDLLLIKLNNTILLKQFQYCDRNILYKLSIYDNNIITLYKTAICFIDFDFNPFPVEITKQQLRKHELYSYFYTDEDLDKLFLFYQLCNFYDIYHYIKKLYLDLTFYV
jgi:hypothetical protein